MSMEYPISARGIIPHRRPMRLVDRVVKAGKDLSGTAEALISRDNIFVDETGFLAPEAMIELMAQAFAAVSGSIGMQKGTHSVTGYLVGVKRFEMSARAREDDNLVIEVRPTGEFAGFVIIDALVRRQGQVLATGELKIWQAPGNDPEYDT